MVEGKIKTPQEILFEAARGGNLKKAEEVIRLGASINKKDRETSFTALHLAAAHGHIDVAKYLISKGADVNALSISRWTPLWLAENNRQDEMMHLLQSYGGKIKVV